MVINMAIYAAIFAIILVIISFRVSNMRRKKRISIGDEGDMELRLAARAQANFVEYTTFFLVLLVVLELLNGSGLLIHVLGILFLLGRILHYYSLCWAEKYENGRLTKFPKFRVAGMLLTFLCILIAAIAILIHWFMAVFPAV